MKTQYLKYLHFGLLIFFVLNFLLGLIFGFKFNATFTFSAKVIFYFSGVILFFLLLKPFKWITLYFSIFIISPIGIIVSWILDGIFGAILGSIFLFFLSPPSHIAADKEYSLRNNYSGFMGTCCSYSIYERKFLIFEKKITDFRYEHSDYNFSDFEVKQDTANIMFKKLENYGEDTTIVLKIK